jgi:saccharopine dehydrogenase-like NADP-dependent oxidoreductase
MLRPIEANLSIFTAEQRAAQVKDPSAHQFQSLQQEEIAKRVQHEAQAVQPTDKSEAGNKVKERKDGRNKDERRNKKRRDASAGTEETEEKIAKAASITGRLDFLA